MKIAIVNRHYLDHLGGSEIQSDMIATNLQDAGHQVLYLSFDCRSTAYQAPYPIIQTKLNFFRLLNIFTKERPEVIYWRNNRTNILSTLLAAKLLHIKFVFALSSPDDYKIKYRLKAQPDSWFAGVSNYIRSALSTLKNSVSYLAFFFVDGFILQLANQRNSFRQKKQTIIYNSSRTNFVPFDGPAKYVVWVSNLKKQKHPETFIDLARKSDSSISFLMVGKIQEKEYIDLLDRPDLPDNFIYLGERSFEEVNGIIAGSLFLVHTCEPEGFPNVMIQAWSVGRPTITLHYDPDNFISDNKLGRHSVNFETLIKDVDEYIHNDELRISSGNAAMLFSNNNFRPAANTRKLLDFLREVVEEE